MGHVGYQDTRVRYRYGIPSPLRRDWRLLPLLATSPSWILAHALVQKGVLVMWVRRWVHVGTPESSSHPRGAMRVGARENPIEIALAKRLARHYGGQNWEQQQMYE